MRQREVKFRVWDSIRKEWFRPKHKFCGIGLSIPNLGLNKGFILQQYVEHKDKNGKEIYEGDVCKVQFESFGEQVCTVEYSDLHFRFFTIPECEASIPMSLNGYIYSIEVIGNIYDNPELIKQKPYQNTDPK